MAINKFYIFSIIFASLILGCYNNVFADGIDMGAFKLYPAIRVNEQFTDNVYLLPSDEQSDYITTIAPELFLEGKCSGNNIFKLNYSYGETYYKKLKINNTKTSNFVSELKIAGSEYYFQIDETYQQLSAPTSYATALSSYSTNDTKLTIGANFNRLSYTISAEELKYDYKPPFDIDTYSEDIIDIIGYYRFLEKVKALGEYKYGKIDYDLDTNKSGYLNEFLIGLNGELLNKLVGTIKMGYQERHYKGLTDWNNPVLYTDLVYKASYKTSFSIILTRSASESQYTSENFYEYDKETFMITENLTPKTSLNMSVDYEQDRYPLVTGETEKRKDYLLNLRLALDAKMRKWLISGISYEFKKRDSNIRAFDYIANVGTVYIKATY